MNWLIFAAISIVFITLANLFQRVLMKDNKDDPIAYSIVFQFLLTIVAALFAIWKGFILPPIQQFPLNFILGGLLYAFGTTYLFKALQLTGVSEVRIISAFGGVVATFASVFLLAEPFLVPRLIGMALIIFSVILVIRSKAGLTLNRGAIYALFSTIFYGLAVVNDGYLLRFSDTISYMIVVSLSPGIFMLLLYPKSIFKLKSFLNPQIARNMFLLSVFYAIQGIAYFWAIKSGALVSQMAPIYRTEIILTVLLAALFLKERDRLPLKLFSAVLTIVGIILIK